MNIEVRDLSFAYGAQQVLKNVSFKAREGELLSVLGPNGVGKSTLFRCVLGLLKSYRGAIYADDTDISKIPAKQLAHLVAYIPQSHQPAFNYAVLDVVLMGTAHQVNTFVSPGQKEMAQAYAAIEQIGIMDLVHKSFLRLSGGEQQLVLIARALAQQAKTLLMDEPTSNLDFGNQLRLMREIRRLSRSGYSIIMSSHNPQTAMNYSDKILALKNGRVIAWGSPDDVMDAELLKELYSVDVRLIDSCEGRMIMPVAGGGCL